MNNQFIILQQSRKLIVKLIENLSIEQLNTIPIGFKNNIAWNIAHLTVTQQLLCYKLSGIDCYASDEMIQKYQKGTFPTHTISVEEFKAIQEMFTSFSIKLENDYAKGIFKTYNEYKTSVNVTLKCIEDGIEFNTYHEGIHLGIILQLLKLV